MLTRGFIAKHNSHPPPSAPLPASYLPNTCQVALSSIHIVTYPLSCIRSRNVLNCLKVLSIASRAFSSFNPKETLEKKFTIWICTRHTIALSVVTKVTFISQKRQGLKHSIKQRGTGIMNPPLISMDLNATV